MMFEMNLILVSNLYPSDNRPYYGTFVRNINDNLNRDGWRTEVISLGAEQSKIVGYLAFYLKVFWRLLRFNGCVYVHYVSHSMPPVIVAWLFNRDLRIVLNYHGSDAFSELGEVRWRARLKRKVCVVANYISKGVVVPSKYFKECIVSSYGVDERLVFVSPSGGVDGKLFNSFGRLERCGCDYTILFAGRFIEEKGCVAAAKVAVSIAKSNKKLRFIFVGGGPLINDVLFILRYLVEEGRCTVVGSVSQHELASYYKLSDFLLFPSVRKGESLGLVLIEAMACGCVPVVRSNGAVKEIFCEELDYLLSDSNEKFEETLHQIVGLDSLALKVIQSDVERVSARYLAENISYELSEFLRGFHE